MNKNLKKIIAIALVFGTVSAVAPASIGNLLTTNAYASDNSTDTLDSLKLETSSGSSINLYSDNDYASDNKVDSSSVSDGDTDYAKTSATTVKLSTSGPSSQYVKVFKGTSSSTKGKSISSSISLSSGSTTTLTVKVYSSTPDSSITYDDDDDVVSTYIIKVKCTASSDSSDSSDSYDDIYLTKLSVAGESISLSNSKIKYSYSVANDVDTATIKAVPEDEDNETVTIDSSDVDSSDSYKKTVSLDVGDNTFEIDLQNPDDSTERVYTLTITRASSSSTSTSTATTTATTTPSTATNVSTTTIKANQWVQVNGAWQYNDSVGNPIKSNWFNDKSSGKWYYLGSDGVMQTGWVLLGGKYYYLNSDGSMAYSTTISGYKLGADGAWVR